MIRLDVITGPQWLALEAGVEVLVEPLSQVVMARAKSMPEVAGLPDDTDADGRFAALTNAIAQLVIADWVGVGDAEGNPLVISADGIAALMNLFAMHRAFAGKYVAKAFLMVAEKNVSALSLNGTSAGEGTTAGPVPGSATTAPDGSTNLKH